METGKVDQLIRVTVSGHEGIGLIDTDGVRRLLQQGYRRPLTGPRQSTKRRIQLDFLRPWGIGSVEEYRRVVGNERTNGPVHWFEPGQELLMSLAFTPKKKVPHYMILDTAIGTTVEFIEDLTRRKMITVEALS